MSESKYRVETKTLHTGEFRYISRLYDPQGIYVDLKVTDTLWGARLWAKRAARKHKKQQRRYEFEVSA